MPKEKYWTRIVGEKDDFGSPIENEFIDGVIKEGHWAIMSIDSWRRYSNGQLGTGWGQRYKKQENGKWLKVEG
jgi:hypothetical protein